MDASATLQALSWPTLSCRVQQYMGIGLLGVFWHVGAINTALAVCPVILVRWDYDTF